MIAYAIRRIALIIPTLFAIMVVNFVIVQAAPGGPVEQMISRLKGSTVSATERVSGGTGEFKTQAGGNDSRYRGARGLAPENTLPAFEGAIEVGADFVEFDVHADHDGRLVVTHDPPRAPGRPLLEEVLETCRGRIGVMVELKTPGRYRRRSQHGIRKFFIQHIGSDGGRAADDCEPHRRDAGTAGFWPVRDHRLTGRCGGAGAGAGSAAGRS